MNATQTAAIRKIEETHGVTIETRSFPTPHFGQHVNLDARRSGRVVAMASVREGRTWEQALADLVDRIEASRSFRHLDGIA